MTEKRSKRREFLPLVFIVKYYLGFKLFLQQQAKFRLALSPVLRDFTDYGIAPIETG